jgi:hypothetical protein
MIASSLHSDSGSTAVDRSTAEFEKPTEASRRATHAALARAASKRRRLVDPTTCERKYSRAELEFMQAMHAYKQRSGRMFPTWSEVLEVLNDLGYRKPS